MTNNITKEEEMEDILDGYESTRVQMGYEPEDRVDMWERGCVYQAMDEWATLIYYGDKFGTWEMRDGLGFPREVTTGQLYEIFSMQPDQLELNQSIQDK